MHLHSELDVRTQMLYNIAVWRHMKALLAVPADQGSWAMAQVQKGY